MAKAKTLTTKQAIEHVLTGQRKPMKVRAIIDAAVPLTGLKGKTPGQVVYSVLYSENKKPDGLVVRAGKGEFKLNPKRAKAAGNGKPKASSAKVAAAETETVEAAVTILDDELLTVEAEEPAA